VDLFQKCRAFQIYTANGAFGQLPRLVMFAAAMREMAKPPGGFF